MIRLDHDRIPFGSKTHSIRRAMVHGVVSARQRDISEAGGALNETMFIMLPSADVVGYYEAYGAVIEVARMIRRASYFDPRKVWFYRVLPIVRDRHIVRHLTKSFPTKREAEAFINSDEFACAMVLEALS